MKTGHPIYILLLAVVIRDGDVIPWFIFPRAPILNMEVYVKFLEKIVLSWIEKVTDRRP